MTPWSSYLAICSFLHHLPLVAIVVLVVLLAAGVVGRPLGVDLLVWHERPWPRFMAGVSLTLLVAEMALVGLLLDRDAVAGLATGEQQAEHYLIAVWLAAGAAAAVTMLFAQRNPFGGTSLLLRVSFPAGVAAGAAAFLGVLARLGSAPFPWLASVSAPVGARLSEWLGVPMPPNPEFHGLAAALTVLLAFGFVAGFVDRHGRWVTPAMSVCTLLGLLASAFGATAFWLDSPMPVAVIFVGLAVVVLMLAGGRLHKVRYPGLREAKLADHDKTTPTPPLLALDTPVKARLQDPRPLAVVCVSGGASRAAAWTAAVLARIEAEVPGFSERTMLITGASGGMVGAAWHVAGLKPPPSQAAPSDWDGPTRAAVAALGADNLSHVVQRLVHADLLSSVLPWALADRGQALEEAWSETLGGRLDRTVGDLHAGEAAGWLPSLVFSPMLVEDGRRLLVSNLDMGPIATNEGPALGGRGSFCSRSELELRKLFPDDGAGLRLATAARMSASFPYVSPAATLPTEPRRRVVDAGYYDNYGVNLAAVWLDANRALLEDRKVVVVQIRDGPSEASLESLVGPKDESSSLSRGLEWLTSPFKALLAARVAAMAYRNDEAIEILGRFLPKLTTVVFEAPDGVSMTWSLAEEEQKSLLKGLRDVDERFVALREWWNAVDRRRRPRGRRNQRPRRPPLSTQCH
jgi:hypothetical protein